MKLCVVLLKTPRDNSDKCPCKTFRHYFKEAEDMECTQLNMFGIFLLFSWYTLLLKGTENTPFAIVNNFCTSKKLKNTLKVFG